MILKSYKNSKKYLDKQQKIDALLVLAKLIEVVSNVSEDNKKIVDKKIEKLLEEL